VPGSSDGRYAFAVTFLGPSLILILISDLFEAFLHAFVDLEAIDLRNVGYRKALWHKVLVREEEQVHEGGTEVGTVQALQSRGLGKVNLLAMWTVDLRSTLPEEVGHADGKDCLVHCLTRGQGASSIYACIVLVEHGRHASASENEASVDEPVEHLRSRLHKWLLVLGDLVVLIIEVQDHVHGILVVWNLGAQPGEIEVILDVILINLHEEFVPLQMAKPLYPCNFLVELGPRDLRVILVGICRHVARSLEH